MSDEQTTSTTPADDATTTDEPAGPKTIDVVVAYSHNSLRRGDRLTVKHDAEAKRKVKSGAYIKAS